MGAGAARAGENGAALSLLTWNLWCAPDFF